jgi:glycosyltransferase involved in cell wall biosynthesis
MITFFIPFYNEEIRKNLKIFLPNLSTFISAEKNKRNEFILVNDGSTDKTFELLKKFIKKHKNRKNISLISNKKNRGVGHSFISALKICKTNYIMPIPSDNDVPLIDYTKYLKNNVDFVMFYKSNMEIYSRNRYALTMLFRMLYGYFFNVQVNYIQSPCIYKCKILKKIKINSKRMSFWPEVNIKMLKSKIKYTEVPMIFKNESKIDRTVSFKNLIEVIFQFIKNLIDINIFNKKKYRHKAKKINL